MNFFLNIIKDFVSSKEDRDTIRKTFFGSVMWQATVFVGLVASYIGSCVYFVNNVESLADLERQLEIILGTDIHPAIFWSVLLTPILIIIIFQGVPAILQFKESRRDKARSFETPAKLSKSAFRLTQIEDIDREEYSRLDRKELEALKWVKKSKGSVLFLSGKSGVGKSSLVSAYLVPELKDAGWAVVEDRAHGNVTSRIAKVLKDRDDLFPRKPSGDPSLQELLGAIGDQQKQKQKIENVDPLLLVIDQFEEIMILKDPNITLQFSELITYLTESSLPKVKLLLIYRSDYESEILNEVLSWGLLPHIQKQNSFHLDLCNRGQAEQFLRKSRLPADDKTREALFRGLDNIEKTQGLYRLITLNMVGLFLERMGDKLVGEPEQLIQNYLVRCITEGVDNSIAARKRILDALVSDAGTILQQTENKLIKVAAQSRHKTVAMLRSLAQNGLVREVKGPETSWEISHDFLASLIGRAIGRLRPTFWSRVKPSFGPLAVIGWMVVLFIGPLFWQQSAESKSREIIKNSGGTFNPIEIDADEGYEVDFDFQTSENCEDPSKWSDVGLAFRSFPQTFVISFDDVDLSPETKPLCSTDWFYKFLSILPTKVGLTELIFPPNVNFLSFEGLNLPDGLTDLTLDSSTISSFEGLSLPEGLTNLSLGSSTISSFEGLNLPDGLTRLDLGRSTVSSLEGLNLPEGLSILDLSRSTISSFKGLNLSEGLTRLRLDRSTISSFEGLNLPEGLTNLDLDRSTISSFEGLSLPDGLTNLDLDRSTISSFEGLSLPDGLTNLDLGQVHDLLFRGA